MNISVVKHIKTYLCSSKRSLDTLNEPAHDKTYKSSCAPSEDSDQHGQPPILIRFFLCPHEKSLGL